MPVIGRQWEDPISPHERRALRAAGYREAPGGAWIRPLAEPALGQVDVVLFDIDGVMMDTSLSFPHVIADVTQWYFERALGWPGTARLIEPADTRRFKALGGFNDDWLCTRAAVLVLLATAARLGEAAGDGPSGPSSLPAAFGVDPADPEIVALRAAARAWGRPSLDRLRQASPLRQPAFWRHVQAAGGGWPALRAEAMRGLGDDTRQELAALLRPDLVARLCAETYAGERCQRMYGIRPRHYLGDGYVHRETPLVRGGDLEPVAAARPGLRFGLYTGRSDGEAAVALAEAELDAWIDPALAITGSTPYEKPDPAGLRAVADRARPRAGLFCGDNVDDWRVVEGYRKGGDRPPFLFAGVLGGVLGTDAVRLFLRLGADLMVPGVRSALDVLARGGPGAGG